MTARPPDEIERFLNCPHGWCLNLISHSFKSFGETSERDKVDNLQVDNKEIRNSLL